MERIDTSDWSIVRVAKDGYVIVDRTLQDEQYHRAFCERYGYEFLSFEKGTNWRCK